MENPYIDQALNRAKKLKKVIDKLSVWEANKQKELDSTDYAADRIKSFVNEDDYPVQIDLQKQIDFTTSREAVSSDFVGSRAAGVVDGLATIASGGKSCVVYVWYDNEYGYSCQVVRMLQHVTKTVLPAFPRTKSI